MNACRGGLPAYAVAATPLMSFSCAGSSPDCAHFSTSAVAKHRTAVPQASYILWAQRMRICTDQMTYCSIFDHLVWLVKHRTVQLPPFESFTLE